MIKKILQFTKERKFISGIIILVLVFGIYFGFKVLGGNTVATSYVLAAVEKGTIITSVSGTGQVSASNQVDVKSKTSGDVVYVNAKNGQEVKAGTLLVQLDLSDAQKTVRDAEIALQRAQLALDKMKGITTEEGTIRGTKEKAADSIKKAYEDGFNSISSIFLELPDIMSGLDSMLFSHDFDQGQQNLTYYANTVRSYNETKVAQYEHDVYDKYSIAREAYDKNFQDYKSTSRSSAQTAIDALINQTYETINAVAEAIKNTNNLLLFYRDELVRRGFKVQSLSTTHLSNLSSYTSKTNNYLVNLLSIKTSIQSDKETFVDANFDIADQEIQVQEAKNDLLEAKEKINDCFIRTPFSGTITEVADIEKGDSISSSTVIATLLTKQKIAEVSLNEVDVANIEIGQKSTLTFDAIEGLTITGEVLEADVIGTVNQGVVSYDIKIGFDTQDERIKSGMTASVSIITDSKQDVLLVPNSAIKASGNISYVEIPNEKITLDAAATNSGIILSTVPGQQQIQIGLANDSYTEITSGLKEGDEIIIRTVNSSSTTSSSSSSNSFRMPGGGVEFR